MALLKGLLPENCKKMFAECFLNCYKKSFNLQYTKKGVKSSYSGVKRSILLTHFLWKNTTFCESWHKLSASLYCHLAVYDSKLSALRNIKMIWSTAEKKIRSKNPDFIGMRTHVIKIISLIFQVKNHTIANFVAGVFAPTTIKWVMKKSARMGDQGL